MQARYSEQLIEILALVGTPYNTYIDDTYWDTQYEQDNTISELLARPLSYQSEADLHEKLKAVTFSGQYGDKLYPKHCIVSQTFDGDVGFMGNKYLVLSGDFDPS